VSVLSDILHTQTMKQSTTINKDWRITLDEYYCTITAVDEYQLSLIDRRDGIVRP